MLVDAGAAPNSDNWCSNVGLSKPVLNAMLALERAELCSSAAVAEESWQLTGAGMAETSVLEDIGDPVPLNKADRHLPISQRSTYSLLTDMQDIGWEVFEWCHVDPPPPTCVLHGDMPKEKFIRRIYVKPGHRTVDKWYLAALLSLEDEDIRNKLWMHGCM